VCGYWSSLPSVSRFVFFDGPAIQLLGGGAFRDDDDASAPSALDDHDVDSVGERYLHLHGEEQTQAVPQS
jgi:hypothetical protein